MNMTKITRKTPAHTPAPWKAVRRECEFGCGDGVPAYFRIVARGQRDDLARTFGSPRQSGNEQAANAQRIVAAVNACEGIPTEALESGVVKELIDALEAMLDAAYDGRMDEPEDREAEAIEMAEAALDKAIPD